jgi:hypothetical protein
MPNCWCDLACAYCDKRKLPITGNLNETKVTKIVFDRRVPLTIPACILLNIYHIKEVSFDIFVLIELYFLFNVPMFIFPSSLRK